MRGVIVIADDTNKFIEIDVFNLEKNEGKKLSHELFFFGLWLNQIQPNHRP